LSDPQEAAEFLAKRAMLGRRMRRVKEAAGFGDTLAGLGETAKGYGSQALKWVSDPKHLATRVPLVGAGIGGLLGAVSSLGREKEERQPFRSALTGALAGGALGLGGVAAKDLYKRYREGTPETPGLEAAQEKVTELEAIPGQVAEEKGLGLGAAAGAGAGAVGLGLGADILGGKDPAIKRMLQEEGKTLSTADADTLKSVRGEGATIFGRPVQSPITRGAPKLNPAVFAKIRAAAGPSTLIPDAEILSGAALPKLQQQLKTTLALGGSGQALQEAIWHLDPAAEGGVKPKGGAIGGLLGRTPPRPKGLYTAPLKAQSPLGKSKFPMGKGLQQGIFRGRLRPRLGTKVGLGAGALAALAAWLKHRQQSAAAVEQVAQQAAGG